MILYSAILILSVFISALSQVLLKKSALKSYASFIREYLNFYVIPAYAIYFLAVFLDLLALRKVPVSFVPVAEASSYIFVLLFGRIFFKETFSKRKILAMILILAGIIVFVV
ncbi:MAG: EamA family transporter [Treponema sp.]|uniref:EamA family transporter n=1 Tax=Treponema sp. TaxID=166 RepID=UPI001B4FF838|nr:EamA family transporter [Treponema sp.]MBP3772411.1 EamA family transporter [Treponema sp.]MBQ9281269.1 EamA family transporter [Treponema sp.]